jgi:hypothetical protein
MKKKLLKPPMGNGEILFLPDMGQFFQSLHADTLVTTCHQLAFFHPGIGIRFLLIDGLKNCKKNLLFMDTDRARIGVRIPQDEGSAKVFYLCNSDRSLFQMELPSWEAIERFLDQIGGEIRRSLGERNPRAILCMDRFRNILHDVHKDATLSEFLARSFHTYYSLDCEYRYLSQILGGERFREFFLKIYEDYNHFRTVYNQALDDFGEEFRFRFKSYPFPRLRDGELPFWVVHRGERNVLKKGEFSPSELLKYTILPKASPLTMFLRLHESDIFLHGVGGANYEWVNDRIIERFLGIDPPPYYVMSATFHIDPSFQRDFPFFLMDPDEIRHSMEQYIQKHSFFPD